MVIRGCFASGHSPAGGVRGLVTVKLKLQVFLPADVMPFIGPAFFAPGDGFFRRPLSYIFLKAAPASGPAFCFLGFAQRRHTPFPQCKT
jgi:hypothetical protein